MNLLTENPSSAPRLVSVEGGDYGESLAALDSLRLRDNQPCDKCGGERIFTPLELFPFGKRGYCMGCGETKYVMDERTNSEVA